MSRVITSSLLHMYVLTMSDTCFLSYVPVAAEHQLESCGYGRVSRGRTGESEVSVLVSGVSLRVSGQLERMVREVFGHTSGMRTRRVP